jgi:hypothetical protein
MILVPASAEQKQAREAAVERMKWCLKTYVVESGLKIKNNYDQKWFCKNFIIYRGLRQQSINIPNFFPLGFFY